MEKKTIYILEDDQNIRELVCYTLTQTGYNAQGFEKPSELRERLEETLPDLLLLDLLLPEENGLDLLKRLRSSDRTEKLPVIILTAKTTEYDKVLGLDSGADDYLTKPFGMMELLSRIKAVLRRTQKTEKKSEYRIGNLRIIPEKHQVLVGERSISLTNKEYKLLKYLVKNEEIVISREKLLNKIWKYDYDGDNRTVDVHIRSLRKKLGDASNIIQTVRGFGYKAVDPNK